jgi:hypothetical protein
MITQDRVISRSENFGSTWKKLIFPQDLIKVDKFYSSKADNRLIGFHVKDGKTFISEDCGRTTKQFSNFSFEGFLFHPQERSWALALSKSCSEKNCVKTRDLYLTKDLGLSWTVISQNVQMFAWGVEHQPGTSKKIPKERIYLTRGKSADMDTGDWSSEVDFFKSDDFFLTSFLLVPRGNRFLLTNKFILVVCALEGDSEEAELMVSSEDPDRFDKIDLPVRKLPQHSFTLLDTTQGSIVIHVNHYSKRSDYGSIYVSDSSGRRFSLSLLHNVRTFNGMTDFEKVKSLEGIFIANVYDKDLYLDNLPEKKTQKDSLKFQMTLISYDKAGSWNRIKAPENDSMNNKVECIEDCFLNFHSLTSSFQSIYSTENAVGLVLATGNRGKFLSYHPDELSLFLSNDGGVNWKEVAKGEHVYETGDHGGIVLIAESQKTSKSLQFSLDEGNTFEKFELDFGFEVDAIINEPTSTSQRFLVYGSIDQNKGVTVSVDFSNLHEVPCRNPEKPGFPESDFEIWTPQTGNAGNCLMGRNVQYVRRKPNVACFNGEELEKPKLINHCECVEEDFECDFGFYREGNGECRPTDLAVREPLCQGGKRIVLSGYRKVAGNSCQEGVSSKYDPVSSSCGNTEISQILWVFGGFLVVLVCFWVLKKHNFDFPKLNWLTSMKKEGFDKKGFSNDLSKPPDSVDDEDGIAIYQYELR